MRDGFGESHSENPPVRPSIYLAVNAAKTAFLLTLMTLLAIGVGDYFGGRNGMVLAFGLAAVTNFISYFFSDKIALAMYQAKPVTRELSMVLSCAVSSSVL